MTIDGYLAKLGRTGPAPAGSAEPRSPNTGVTVLIPTYSPSDGERTGSLRLCLDTVRAARAPGGGPTTVIVVDNGLSATAARDLGAVLRAGGCPYAVVTAPTRSDHRYTAAHARNAGLAYLAALPAGSPLRQRHLLFLDDDSALGPGALRRLRRTLDDRPRAIAACPRVVPVADPADWLVAERATGAEDGEPRALPGPFTCDGRYDLLSVTSHGSLVTGRTVGLLVRQDPVLARIRRHGPLFHEGTPYGSAEDMLAMGVLADLGELWSVPGARVADETRRTPGATREQQFAWGYDHAWLARSMAHNGLLASGLHVLSWRDGHGWEYASTPLGGRTGFLINPTELGWGLRMLQAVTGCESAARAMFGPHALRLRAGCALLERVLVRWRRAQPRGERRLRPDLPALGTRDLSTMRDGIDALIGHLAGNVVGSLDNGPDHGAMPDFFLYGARQPAARPARTGPPETPAARPPTVHAVT